MDLTELNDLIRSAMDQHQVADPRAISTYVIRDISPADLRDALALCLPAQVKRVVHGQRSSSYRASYRQAANIGEMAAREEDAPGTYVSSFSENLLWFRSAMNERVCVEGVWKFLRDCTVADLRSMAAAHRKLADENMERAVMYDELADEMDRRGAGVAGDLTVEARKAA